MDGTLLRVDTLHENLLAFLRQHFWQAWRLIAWLFGGKACFKQQLASCVALRTDNLPACEELVEFLRAEHGRGRRLVLATAADEQIARRVAERFPFFNEVLASDGRTNLGGKIKLARLVERFGEKGFDYAGNSSADLPIWRAAADAIVVQACPAVRRRAQRESNVVREFGSQATWFDILKRVLRIHQWPKNVLLIVPAITGHMVGDWAILERIGLGVVGFCLCASSVYVLNDLHDLDADRVHRTKRARPFAAGQASLLLGLALAPLLLALAFLCAAWLPPMFGFYLAVYFVISTLYSCVLKKVVLLDVFVLAGLYTLRILAGHAATGIGYSNWLLGFSLFTFLSLALLKRYIELHRSGTAEDERLAGRGYQARDLQVVLTMGLGSGYLAALVLALYINSKEVIELYQQPTLLLFICPLLLYWISRVWLLATRDRIDDDPVVFALKDKTSYLVGALVALFIWLASVL
jgi:4-hydroxybenzoate polyprenyltransferase/phosphoserine phosphatase